MVQPGSQGAAEGDAHMNTTITMRLRRGLAAGVVGALALTGATFVASPGSGITSSAEAVVEDEGEKAVCDTDERSTEFGGAAVSKKYGRLFNRSTPAASFLDTYTPQGLGVWRNWRGGPSTEDLFLVGMHHEDEKELEEDGGVGPRGLLYGMTTGGTVRGYAFLPAGAHAGGVKVHNGWVYVQYDNDTILRYSVERVRKAFDGALTGSSPRDLGDGALTNPVTDVSFFDIHGGYLYGGYHNDEARGHMFRYRIMSDGNLVQDHGYGPIQIPTKAQGIQVLNDTWIFSTSLGRGSRGNVYVIRRGYEAREDFTTVRYRCFQSVSMIQELVGYKGRTYLLNESAADEMNHCINLVICPIHDIRHLHRAKTEKLRDLVW